MGLAASYVNFGYANNALSFTSSHNGTAERQFRYPLEYGVQKKETSTYTVTGGCCSIVTNQKREIIWHFSRPISLWKKCMKYFRN